ncbi:Zinc finger protein [Trichinella spiralis]|uniref:Zinc finger protein n=1 Tax=Trichinella spiralis TaxID=6334 RepID=A0ABR3KIK0_TRISP
MLYLIITSYCEVTFLQSGIMNKHNCCKCGKSIIGETEWLDHVKDHLHKEEYICSICGMDFPFPTELIEHGEEHRPSCSKKWIKDLKSKNDEEQPLKIEERSKENKINAVRQLKFEGPEFLQDLRNHELPRETGMPTLMKQIDELKLQASLFFDQKNDNNKKESKYDVLESRCAKKSDEIIRKWNAVLEFENPKFKSFPELCLSMDFFANNQLNIPNEMLFGSNDKNETASKDSDDNDDDDAAFNRIFKKYLEEEKAQEERDKLEKEKKQDNEEKKKEETKKKKDSNEKTDIENFYDFLKDDDNELW